MANAMSSRADTTAAASTTEPGPDHQWKVTLDGKVIASIAEVCLANLAKAVYSLDINDPGEDFSNLKQKYENLHYITVDIRSNPSIENAINKIYDQEGHLNGFVANAGMTKHQAALDFTEEQLHQIVDLNILGTYNCATSIAKTWISKHKPGSIVFTASMTSYRPNRAAPSAPYGGTKAFIRNITHTLAHEWTAHGIRVNSVSPGFVRTQMTSSIETAPDWDLKTKYYGGMPRMARPQELGGAYVYLLSDAASYTTGIDIPVAGGVGAW
ncbi:MAG: hypothetical protein Q9221_003628 [Calogaya cf. arnoldii]